MLLVGEDPKKYINEYSNQFQRDFLQLLRTAHGEKQVHLNHFYQEYISNKEHTHMNATKWPSLTEFAKHLGREGICRVEENEKGLHIAWIDNSPEALRRQEAVRRKEMQDKGDEIREQMLIREQVKRAQAEKKEEDEIDDAARELKRNDGEKIKLSFGVKPTTPSTEAAASGGNSVSVEKAVDFASSSPQEQESNPQAPEVKDEGASATAKVADASVKDESAASIKMGFKMGGLSKPKNVFAAAKKNALGGKKGVVIEQPKKMSEAERIMKEEIERKRARDVSGNTGAPFKKQRF
jgi:DNA/RNA-binding protein KIN17